MSLPLHQRQGFSPSEVITHRIAIKRTTTKERSGLFGSWEPSRNNGLFFPDPRLRLEITSSWIMVPFTAHIFQSFSVIIRLIAQHYIARTQVKTKQCRSLLPSPRYSVRGLYRSTEMSISSRLSRSACWNLFWAIHQDLALILSRLKTKIVKVYEHWNGVSTRAFGGDIINERAQEFSHSFLLWNQSVDSLIPLLDETCYEGGHKLPVMVIPLRHYWQLNHFYVCQKRTKKGINHSSLYRKKGILFYFRGRVW